MIRRLCAWLLLLEGGAATTMGLLSLNLTPIVFGGLLLALGLLITGLAEISQKLAALTTLANHLAYLERREGAAAEPDGERIRLRGAEPGLSEGDLGGSPETRP